MTEEDNSDLIAKIGCALKSHRYLEVDRDIPIDESSATFFVTPRRWMSRYACAVIRVSDNSADLSECKQLKEKVRNVLSERYGQCPWYKEVGIYAVYLCSHALFSKIQGHEAEFNDNTGMHVSVMLGSCFVDVDKQQVSSEATWGLFSSQKHYISIVEAAVPWCKDRQNKASDPS